MSDIQRVLIWSGWSRLSHACIALSVLALLFTGWLIAESPSLQEFALDLHYLAAGLLLFGLIVRAVLFIVGREHERLAALFPVDTELRSMTATLRFYLSLARAPLPGWYAHNPLWKPLYLLIYLVLVIQVATGAAMPDIPIVLGFYLPEVHAFWAQVVLWFSVLHIASTIVHDYKNQSADVSAMINGYRVFTVDHARANGASDNTRQYISIDSLRKDD